MFEHRSQSLLPRKAFFARIAWSVAATAGIVAFSLSMGSAGYHYLGELPWIDALLNASMILAGMGPVDPIRSTGAKLFASFYALYSGIAFLGIIAILMAPILHRFLHKFHLEFAEEQSEEDQGKKRARGK
jgi:hypothetical protein